MNKTKPAKNNNLSVYRQKLAQINETLIQKAIEHIVRLGGEVTFSSVSKVTYDIADQQNGESGLTLAAISKNKIYRSMVEKAQVSRLIAGEKQKYSPTMKYSIGDMQFSLHELRVQNAKLKMDNKILVQKLKEVHIPIKEVGNIEETIIKKAKEIQNIANSMVNRLLELELAYIDTSLSTLNVAMYDTVLVTKEALNLFFQKELNELQSKIR